jgi:CxxC motif-containing protein
MELQTKLRKVETQAPVKMGAVVVHNILDTGIDIIASRDMEVAADLSKQFARTQE